jgi:glycogenin glucosyltransferase
MKTAYVTMLCGGDRYVPGAEVLGRSLRASGTRAELVLLATADVTRVGRARLRAQGWSIRDVAPIPSPHPEAHMLPRFADVFTKLRAWELEEFDRVVLLDADTLVLRNVDELFDRPAFAAAPDFFLPDRFNSGVVVLAPSRATFADMVQALDGEAGAEGYDGGDQGFLNAYFANWYSMPREHRLPVGYNTPNFIFQFLHGHPTVRERVEREVKILHYLVQKPWLATSTLTGGSEPWWRTWYEVHPRPRGPLRARWHALEDWTFDRLAKLVVG